MADETLEAPTTEEAPKQEFDTNELLELGESTTDPVAEELTTAEVDNPATAASEKEELPKPKDESELPPKEVVREEPPVVEEDYKLKASELEQQLEFYRTLYGDERPPTREAAAPIAEQPKQQQQSRNPLDYVTPSKEELYDLMSGEPEKATPIIRKFIAAAVAIAQHNVQRQQQEHSKVTNYIGGVQKVFYEKYPDLDKVRPLVKMAGDQVADEYEQKGIRKLPHELIDDIGKRAYQLRSQLVGGNNPPPTRPRTVVKQGEVGGTKNTPPASAQLTDQQKEMLDVLEV